MVVKTETKSEKKPAPPDNSKPVNIAGGGEELTPEQIKAKALIDAGIQLGEKTDETTTSIEKVQINLVAAKALLEAMMIEIGYTGTFNKKDLLDFVNKFNDESSLQIDKAIRQTNSERTSGGTAEEVNKNKSTSVTTKMLSLFDPKQFARDFIWTKVNFKNDGALPTKALDVLRQVREQIKGFNLNTISETEIKNEAKLIATGKKTLDDLKENFSQQAQIYYPAFALRLKDNPGANIRDLSKPAISVLSKIWEIPEDEIDLDDPILDSWLRPDGFAGKVSSPPLSALRAAAINDKKYDITTTAIDSGVESAKALAQAMGY
jgi:hypothetical protein